MSSWLREELTRIDQLFEESLRKWIPQLHPLLDQVSADHHWQALPVSTAAINRLLGATTTVATQMGTLFRLYYLGNFVHSLIKDDDEGQTYDRELQFNILIGDFIYGRGLHMLGEMGQERLLPLFAEMIAEVNEGKTLALADGQPESVMVISKQVGSVYRSAFRAAGIVNGLYEPELTTLELAGWNLGMSVAAKQLGWSNWELFDTEFKGGILSFKGRVQSGNQLGLLEHWINVLSRGRLQVNIAG